MNPIYMVKLWRRCDDNNDPVDNGRLPLTLRHRCMYHIYWQPEDVLNKGIVRGTKINVSR